MSDQAAEAIELPRSDDAAFADLMDTLAPIEEAGEGAAGAPAAGAEGGAAGAAPAAGAAGAGTAAAAAAGGGGTGGASATPVAGGNDAAGGAAGGPDHAGNAADGAADGAGAAGGGGADAAGGGGDRPADWTASAADVAPELDKLSTALEERTIQAYQQTALTEVQKEHAKYFEALNQHPRLLVGKQVPAIGGAPGATETLRDADDAREWQDAVKQLLVQEVRGRASRQLDENKDFLTTIHSSIDLFKNNPDLIPGTQEFDIDLANRFTTMAAPYELRVEGKLQGYSIAVQPLIEQIRNQVIADRTAAKVETPATTTGAPAAPAPPRQADPPQAGIPARSGAGGDPAEDFSTLFATIDPSLSSFQI